MRVALGFVWLTAAATGFGQFSGSFVLPVEDEAFGYTKPADDPVARLQKRIDAGEVKLERKGDQGYLRSLLEALEVPVESQVLVFSKTSFQQNLISPAAPRALYFNDDVYVGYVQSGEVLELSAVDPQKGGIFYTLDQHPRGKLKFARHDDCLQCHASPKTLGVPGHIMRSVYPDAEGFPQLQAGSYVTTPASPFSERWGGWFVTGSHGTQRHMGNVWSADKTDPEKLDREAGANLRSLDARTDLSGYIGKGSDIVALMVLAHQHHMHNLITRVSYETRLALSQQEGINQALGRPLTEWSDSTKRRIFGGAEALLKALLFADEVPLAAPVKGYSGFAEQFAKRGARDSHGRSLRDFDLQTRLFRYPVSFLVYSEAFEKLPGPAKAYAYKRLAQILTADKLEKDYAALERYDRKAMLDILCETKPEFAAAVQAQSRIN